MLTLSTLRFWSGIFRLWNWIVCYLKKECHIDKNKIANKIVTKYKKANSVDPEETAHMSYLISIYIVYKIFFLIWGVEMVKSRIP